MQVLGDSHRGSEKMLAQEGLGRCENKGSESVRRYRGSTGRVSVCEHRGGRLWEQKVGRAVAGLQEQSVTGRV